MKTERNYRNIFLLMSGMMLLAGQTYANDGGWFNKYIASEFHNLTGLYIILGVILLGIVGKLFQIYIVKAEEAKKANKVHISRHKYHKPRPIVKKTS